MLPFTELRSWVKHKVLLITSVRRRNQMEELSALDIIINVCSATSNNFS